VHRPPPRTAARASQADRNFKRPFPHAGTVSRESARAQSVAGFGFLRVLGESIGIASANADAGLVDQFTLLPAYPAFIG